MRNILWNTKTRRNKVFPMWLVLCAFVFLFSVESNAQFRINLGGGSPLRKLQIAEQGGKKSDFITRYCYSEEERLTAISELGPDPEITRFKGLGEISPDEFAGFIGPDIRLEQVTLHKTDQVQKLLEYYMGKNTMERQNFIIDNLVIEEDRPEEDVYD